MLIGFNKFGTFTICSYDKISQQTAETERERENYGRHELLFRLNESF